MISRPFWQQRIEEAWRETPIVWLAGVRRSGKTTLAESLGGERALYMNCDLPSVEDMLVDPQVFFRTCAKPVVVFDEIHQLRDPARLLLARQSGARGGLRPGPPPGTGGCHRVQVGSWRV